MRWKTEGERERKDAAEGIEANGGEGEVKPQRPVSELYKIMILYHFKTDLSFFSTDIPGYSDTGYSDTPLTVTLLAGPEGVTVSWEVCTAKDQRS